MRSNIEKYKSYLEGEVLDKLNVKYVYKHHTDFGWFTFNISITGIVEPLFPHQFYYDQDLSDGEVALFRGNTNEKQYMMMNNKFKRHLKDVYSSTKEEINELWDAMADNVDSIVHTNLMEFLNDEGLWKPWVMIRFTKFPRSEKITELWANHKERVASSGSTVTNIVM